MDPTVDRTATVLRYVALGDSYTIGTSVPVADRWPDRLVAWLSDGSPRLELVANPALNGRTSADVLDRQLREVDRWRPDLVSLLIGVNDVVQGVSEARYRGNVEQILDRLLARLAPNRLFAVTTPDYTVTPAGAEYGDPDRQRAGIVAKNRILTEAATGRGLAIVDIFDLSSRAATDPTLVAHDGLHPSGKQYALWVERIGPLVRRLIEAG